MEKSKRNKGITLVALVVTIIILLILAGISIQALTQTNLFDKTKQAKNAMENAQNQENEILSSYMEEMNRYLSDESNGNNDENDSKVETELAKRVKVGDYVNYIPDNLNETELITLKNNLNTYSGVVNNEKNTINPAIKRDNLKWRVLDIDKTTGEVRLISETPTDSKIQLDGYNGYNNAVKLIDDACNTLYNNKTLASKVQNLKIEDVTPYMTTQPEEDETEYNRKNIQIPNILKQEENQIVEGSTTPLIGESEQHEFVTGSSKSSTSTLKNMWWKQSIDADTSFENKIYYELFIKKDENYYSTYWMSSRCVLVNSSSARFDARCVEDGNIATHGFNDSIGNNFSHNYAFRPVVTLKTNIQIDTDNSGSGAENLPYNIKEKVQ